MLRKHLPNSVCKQIDPQFRREEARKQENERVSQWLDRCIQDGRYNLGITIKDEYIKYIQKTRGVCRERNEYVEAQMKLLFVILDEYKKMEELSHYRKLKFDLIRMLGVQHQGYKRQVNSL